MKFATKTFLSLGLIVMLGLVTFVNGQTKRIWHLTVASRDDMGETAEKFKADLKEAFEAIGDEVVDEASKESTDLNFYLGKDDDDDDNDGAVDDKDVSDSNGDGIVNEQDMAEVFDLDEEIPDVMKGYPDNEKDEGIYIYLEKETGLAMVFISKADSLNGTGVATLSGNGFFQKASFVPRNSFMVDKAVANQVVKTVDNRDERRIYVGNVSPATTTETVQYLFENVASIVKIERDVISRESGLLKTYLYITYPNPQNAKDAISRYNGMLLNGMPLIVQEREDPRSRPGGGGKSRSGYGGGGYFKATNSN